MPHRKPSHNYSARIKRKPTKRIRRAALLFCTLLPLYSYYSNHNFDWGAQYRYAMNNISKWQQTVNGYLFLPKPAPMIYSSTSLSAHKNGYSVETVIHSNRYASKSQAILAQLKYPYSWKEIQAGQQKKIKLLRIGPFPTLAESHKVRTVLQQHGLQTEIYTAR